MFDLFVTLVAITVAISPFFIYYIYYQNKKGEESKRNRNRLYHARRKPGYRENSKIYSTVERKKILAFTDGRCFYCMAFLNKGYWEIDHLWAKKIGGVDAFFNLVASCRKCNASKWFKNPFYHLVHEWSERGYLNEYQIKFLRYYSINSPSRLTNNPNWVSFMDTACKNISDFLEAVENNPVPSSKEKRGIYEKYTKIFFDQPPKETRWG
jgi:5-methylcytosine-specific restriction endonuclease McrA